MFAFYKALSFLHNCAFVIISSSHYWRLPRAFWSWRKCTKSSSELFRFLTLLEACSIWFTFSLSKASVKWITTSEAGFLWLSIYYLTCSSEWSSIRFPWFHHLTSSSDFASYRSRELWTSAILHLMKTGVKGFTIFSFSEASIFTFFIFFTLLSKFCLWLSLEASSIWLSSHFCQCLIFLLRLAFSYSSHIGVWFFFFIFVRDFRSLLENFSLTSTSWCILFPHDSLCYTEFSFFSFRILCWLRRFLWNFLVYFSDHLLIVDLFIAII